MSAGSGHSSAAVDLVAPSLEGKRAPREGHAENAKYYPVFDFLRITLAVGVFTVHGNLFSLGTRVPNLGNFCVQVFFALSGYLIGGILRDSTLSSLPRFYFNRTTRIWLPYLIANVLLAMGCVVRQQPVTFKMIEFFFYKLTFTYNLFGPQQLATAGQFMPLSGTGNHFWSICVEEQFYLAAPLLITALGRWAPIGFLVFGIAATLAYPAYFASITLGVLLALSERGRGQWFRRRRYLWVALPVLGLVAGGFWFGKLNYFTGAPAAAIVIVALSSGRGRQSGVGQFLGGISYPFYLNHWVGLMFVKKISHLGLTNTIAIFVALAVSLAVASAHFLAVDRNIQRYRGGWFSVGIGRFCAIAGFTLVATGIALHPYFPKVTPEAANANIH